MLLNENWVVYVLLNNNNIDDSIKNWLEISINQSLLMSINIKLQLEYLLKVTLFSSALKLQIFYVFIYSEYKGDGFCCCNINVII